MHGKFDELGRFADPSLLILTSLSDGPKHGYAVMTDVAEFSGVAMEPGTLYGALSRLERRGWVRPLGAEERRRPYEITAAGQAVLAEQVASMNQIVQVARLRTGLAGSADLASGAGLRSGAGLAGRGIAWGTA
jgi:DNA-binding PadR family transcriptional regulator